MAKSRVVAAEVVLRVMGGYASILTLGGPGWAFA
jgi:hypothetical protein